MATGREMSEWNRTSHVLAWIQNWSGFSDQGVGPKELNPMVPAEDGPCIDAMDLAIRICGSRAVKHFSEADSKSRPL